MADQMTTGGDAGTGGSPSPAAPTSAPASSSAPYALTDDSEILVPGSTTPVKYKDFVGGYVPKADLTRMRQQDRAQLAEQQRTLKQQEATLQQAAQQLAGRLGPQGGQGPDLYQQLEALPYVDGKTQATIMRHVVGALQQYQQALGLMQQRVQTMERGYGTLQGQSRTQAVEGLFGTVRQNLGLPANNAELNRLIENEYLAHDRWETVSPQEQVQFLQQLVKGRLEGLRTYYQQQNQQRAEAARTTSPLRTQQPLKIARQKGRLPGSETPAELANALFPLIAGAPNT